MFFSNMRREDILSGGTVLLKTKTSINGRTFRTTSAGEKRYVRLSYSTHQHKLAMSSRKTSSTHRSKVFCRE